MNKNLGKRLLLAAAACIVVAVGISYYYFFTSMLKGDSTEYVYIDDDDTIDSVLVKLRPIANAHSMSAFSMLANHTSYAQHVRSGRYALTPGAGALTVFRHMKNGLQSPVSLTVPSVRTIDKLASELSRKLMIDGTALYRALTDERACRKYG